MPRYRRPIPTPVNGPRLVTDQEVPDTSSPLGRATTNRLRNQLTRAFQHGFGAEQGLRVLVSLATEQMLAAGVGREAIHSTLQDIVRDHPASQESRSRMIDGQTRADALTAMILRWSDRTCAEDAEAE